MVRYFFDFRSDDACSLDEEGEELLDAGAAHKEALGALADAIQDIALEGATNQHFAVEVRDDLGQVLGGVDSKDSLLGANQIQGCFWGGSLGCDGPFGFERCGMGTDGASDHRSARPERLDRARQSDVRGRRALDRSYGLSLA
jgi:hypothetical protein